MWTATYTIRAVGHLVRMAPAEGTTRARTAAAVAATAPEWQPGDHPVPLMMALIMPCWVTARVCRLIIPNPYWPFQPLSQ